MSAEARRGSASAGVQIAVAAVVVNVARLTLAFLEADGIEVGARLRAGLLAITGIASGVVLTGGGAYLAHALSRARRWRPLLAVVWALVLCCAAILVTPALVAGLAGSNLSAVLDSGPLRWAWSSTAVLAVELVAAGSMVAYAAERQQRRRSAQTEEELLELARERNQLEARLRELEAAPASAPARTVRRPATAARRPSPCRFGCGFVGASSAAERGHLRSCRLRPRGGRGTVPMKESR